MSDLMRRITRSEDQNFESIKDDPFVLEIYCDGCYRIESLSCLMLLILIYSLQYLLIYPVTPLTGKIA